MSGYTSSIRSIERTNHYMPINSVRRYNNEPISAVTQTASIEQQDRNMEYYRAADSAAEWLRFAKEAQSRIDDIQLNLREKIDSDGSTQHDINNIVLLINDLEQTFRSHETNLTPEVWAVIELALRHPATELLGNQKESVTASPAVFERNQEELHHQSLADKERIRTNLLRTDDLLNDLKHALSYAEQQKSVDLLQFSFPSSYPYAMYYGGVQTNWPLPMRGTIINKYY